MFMNLNDFLSWLVYSGGSIIAVSWVLEQVNWYKEQSPQLKKWVFFGLSAVVSVTALLVVNFVPAQVLQAIAPYFAAIAITFVNVFLGEVFHTATKEKAPVEVVQTDVVQVEEVGKKNFKG
jgi:hypothetical protein